MDIPIEMKRYTVDISHPLNRDIVFDIFYRTIAKFITLDDETKTKVQDFLVKTRRWNDWSIAFDTTSAICYELVDYSGIEPLVWSNEDSKLPKRVAKFIKDMMGIKLPTQVIANFGEEYMRVDQYRNQASIDFTKRFDWEDGDFGDEGSCFWGSNSYAKTMIKELNGFACRVWDKDYECGTSRCWCIPIRHNGSWLLTIFNAYSTESLKLEWFARAIASITGWNFSQIKLTNNGYTGDTLYINGSGSGIVLYPPGASFPSKYDYHCTDNTYSCYSCDENFDEEDLYEGTDDEKYCRECWDERFYDCEECGRTRRIDNAIYINDSYYCPTCINKLGYVQCYNCDEYRQDCNNVDGNAICDDCMDGIEKCENCGEYVDTGDACIPLQDAHEFLGRIYCGPCYEDEIKGRCLKCGAELPEDEQDYETNCLECRQKERQRQEGWMQVNLGQAV